MTLKNWYLLFLVLGIIGFWVPYPWKWFFHAPWLLFVGLMIGANKQWRGSRFFRRVAWKLFVFRHMRNMLSACGPLMTFPMLVWLTFEGRDHYLALGHDRFCDYVISEFEKKGKQMMDGLSGKAVLRRYTKLEQHGLTRLDSDLDNPANWDKDGNFINPRK